MDDTDRDRIIEERAERAEADYRESKGRMLCPNCGAEVFRIFKCGQCELHGCVHCFKYDEGYAEHFCTVECFYKRLVTELDSLYTKIKDMLEIVLLEREK